jgi:hypothetical protein
MTSLPESFSQTSNGPYDRHDYKLVYSNGQSKVFSDYMELQATWFQTPSQFLGHVEVLDKKEEKKITKGFG